MEWRILLDAVCIVLIPLPQMEAVCVGTDCHALRERSVRMKRKTNSTEHCPENCVCNSSLRLIVDCSHKGLLEIPTQASALQNASELFLDSNEIREIRSGLFSSMEWLNNLVLNRNRISTIESGALEGLTNLLVLRLENNLIKHIPNNVFNRADVPELQYIDLSNNKLEIIESETFSNLTELDVLYLNHNRITYISQDAFKGLTKLSTLNLYDNSLTSAAWVVGLPSLQMLNIGANLLKTLHTNILDSLYNIEFLNLEANPWICDQNLKLVYDALKVPGEISCRNPRNLTQRIKVADLSNETLEMFTSAEKDTTHSQASARLGQSQPPLVIIGICSGVVGLVRWSIVN
ncbi:variable lymphocyte receptor b [Plakobranchus ocellatus]|uniref:Variable lymphocyte receptor b n=1 Tax=Plakobranchus ocellatus TaxID=259542 RepID=A0AAV3XX59_9GAST|nr:variable lymphocyte receptor b [Plakobranchus ocellatus]